MLINLKTLPLGKQIQIKRILEGVGQAELAEALGFSNAVLSRCENGKEELPKKHLPVVMDYLNNKIR